jgi:hypothetical protein
LLIVFLFAAVIAIMLYSEMPVTAFEARRQKEQLLIDRANEYKHAVKLYYRKVSGYPSAISQLENTNRMRFLRHRFKDPFTDKDDWRLLHMGPGNMLLDSKIKNTAAQAGTGAPTSATATSGASSFGGGSSFSGASSFSGNTTTASTSSFGSGSNNSSSFGSNMSGFTGLSSSDSQPTVKVPPVRQRGPAIPAGAGGAEGGDMQADTSADNAIPMPPEMPAAEMPSNATPSAAQASPSGGAPNGGQSGNNGSNSSNPAQNPTQMVQGLFGSQSPRQGMSTSSNSGAMNGGGGIAGVASKASGESIKSINDQTDYSLWEFYYDPSKDVQPGLGGAAGGTAASVGTGSVARPVEPSAATNPAGQSGSFFSNSTLSSGSSSGSSSGNNSGNPSSSGRSSGTAQNAPQQ